MNESIELEPGANAPLAPLRLRPEMVDFRALVLAAVREYYRATGRSPSFGEIAARTGATRDRVAKTVRRLVRDGVLLRASTTRGLVLPDARANAVRRLRELGWWVDEARAKAVAPVAHPATDCPLRPQVVLDYPAEHVRTSRSAPEPSTDRLGGAAP